MIKAVITGNMIKRISSIEQNRFSVSTVELPTVIAAKLRKSSKKKSREQLRKRICRLSENSSERSFSP